MQLDKRSACYHISCFANPYRSVVFTSTFLTTEDHTLNAVAFSLKKSGACTSNSWAEQGLTSDRQDIRPRRWGKRENKRIRPVGDVQKKTR